MEVSSPAQARVRTASSKRVRRSRIRLFLDGTVMDDLTGLTWLKDASCLGAQSWANALAAANTLANGNVACGLTDGSIAGNWRLRNRNELASLLDLGTNSPALPANHPFLRVADFYWSSTTLATGSVSDAWFVDFNFGSTGNFDKTLDFFFFATAVRGGL